MTTEFADWLGRHPDFAFLLLTTLCAGLATLAWRALPHPLPPGFPPSGSQRGLLIGLALAGTALFALLAMSLRTEGRLLQFDLALAEALARHAQDGWLQAWALLTVAGDRKLLIALSALVVGLLLWRRRWEDAALWVAATAGAGVLNLVLKAGFARERPEHLHGFAHAHGWSFPSGHATGAMAFYGMLAYLLVRAVPPRWAGVTVVLAAVAVAAIGYSRVLLQVHYFSDVAAAFAVTLAWLALCLAVRAGLSGQGRAGRPPQAS